MTFGGELFRLVRLVGGHREGGVAAVFVCYLDDSDAEGSPVVTLAGYVGLIDRWEWFEEQASRVYDDFGVGILHAKEFEDRRGAFKKWDRDKSKAFLDALYEGALERFYAVSFSTAKVTYNERRKEVGSWETVGPYGLAFGSIVGHLMDGPISSVIKQHGLSFVVESGHKNNPGIADYFHKLKKSRTYWPLRSFTESGKQESRAIQLADLFAFYTRRWATRMEALEKPSEEYFEESGDPFLNLIKSKTAHAIWVTKDPFGAVLKRDPTTGNPISISGTPASPNRIPCVKGTGGP
jgi:uncharacterized protein DUF3800